jgi:hypothetical protein
VSVKVEVKDKKEGSVGVGAEGEGEDRWIVDVAEAGSTRAREV